jgi:nucleotide-binding universal stress UspA family protein
MKTNKILIVGDDSPASIKAIQYGFSLASSLGAKVALLTVVDPGLTIGNPDAGIFPDDALINVKTKMAEFLTNMKNKYSNDVDTKLMLQVGEIQDTVIDIALQWEAGIIVTGTHNRTGFSRLFNGSISESIVQHSPVPVLVVPMDK